MIHCSPFPSQDRYGDPSLWLEARRDMERLLSCCGDEFVAQHAPEMTIRRNHHGKVDRWEFPLGTAIGQLRPRLIKLWPLMPESGKQLFLLLQFYGGMAYVQECAAAFENAELEIPAPIGKLTDCVESTILELARQLGQLLDLPANLLAEFQLETGQPVEPGRTGRSLLRKDSDGTQA